MPTSGVNLIVIQDTGTSFNAGQAANAIANAVTADGAGFFVYHNVLLGMNRLVYSTNLNVNTADLAVLARIEAPFGTEALQALSGFSANNFALTSAVLVGCTTHAGFGTGASCMLRHTETTQVSPSISSRWRERTSADRVAVRISSRSARWQMLPSASVL